MSTDPYRPYAGSALAVSVTAARFADVALGLSGIHDVRNLLGGIVRAATQLVDAADFSSAAIGTSSGHYATLGYTNRDALLLDEVQYITGRGPGLEATRIPGLGVVFSADLSHGGGPWPELAVVAADHEVRSVLSVGLFPTAAPPRHGVLNLYARRPHALTGADHRDTAVILAAHVGAVLANLARDLDSRDMVRHGEGTLMYRLGATSGEGASELPRAPQPLNVETLRPWRQ